MTNLIRIEGLAKYEKELIKSKGKAPLCPSSNIKEIYTTNQ